MARQKTPQGQNPPEHSVLGGLLQWAARAEVFHQVEEEEGAASDTAHTANTWIACERGRGREKWYCSLQGRGVHSELEFMLCNLGAMSEEERYEDVPKSPHKIDRSISNFRQEGLLIVCSPFWPLCTTSYSHYLQVQHKGQGRLLNTTAKVERRKQRRTRTT